MGLTVLEIEVGNPSSPDVTETIEFLIDSGAIYSVVPTPVLERLGILPLTEQEFRLADGSKSARKKGIALFRYGGRVGGADVIFGEETVKLKDEVFADAFAEARDNWMKYGELKNTWKYKGRKKAGEDGDEKEDGQND